MTSYSKQILQKVQEYRSKKLFVNAAFLLREALEKEPDSQELRFAYAQVSGESRDFYTAATVFDELVHLNAEHPVYLVESANAWSRLGEIDKAVQYCQEAVRLTNSGHKSVISLANIYEQNNRWEEAESLLLNSKDKLVENGNYQRLRVRILMAQKKFSEAIDQLNQFLKIETKTVNQVKLLFLMSKVFDQLGEFDNAWRAASKAHELDGTGFDEHSYLKSYEEMRAFLTKEVVDSLAKGVPEQGMIEPLFVVSSPRSGTSLLEQIMGMHPDIENGGEMPSGSLIQNQIPLVTDSFHQWPMSLVDLTPSDVNSLAKQYHSHCDFFKGTSRIVSNKALNLYPQLGFLSLVLPNSRAVFLHRNPLDHAVSCFTNNLLEAGLPYTNRIETIGKVWIERYKMAQHWQDTLPIKMLVMNYEELVENQRSETERLLEFLDVPWHDDCMAFHKSKRIARTISYNQVNQKMYSSARGRWKNYEKHLGPLIDVLGSFAEYPPSIHSQ